MGKLASLTITPVISFVSDAIGSTACSFLLNSTSRVSWSITSTTPDFRSNASCVWCSPASSPNEGFAATMAVAVRLRFASAAGLAEPDFPTTGAAAEDFCWAAAACTDGAISEARRNAAASRRGVLFKSFFRSKRRRPQRGRGPKTDPRRYSNKKTLKFKYLHQLIHAGRGPIPEPTPARLCCATCSGH